ncbi:TonB-dependent receptor [Gillisia sp. Q332]|uniref:TonB-dependent receptor n=1 Tax=Gillisia xinjiangensis TaxID=3384765 RepID=UPI003918A22D
MMRKLLLMALFLTSATIFAQGTITGTVIDSEMNAPLPGATVVVVGTTNGTTTDFEGKFSLNVATATGRIEISFIGFERRSANFNVASGQTQDLGRIVLTTDADALSEIIVIGRGVMDLEEDRRTPIAVSTITKSEIQQKAVGNVEFPELMKNVPSVYVSNQTGFGDSQMFLRGFDQTNTAFLLNGQPINGMEDGKMYWSNWAGMADIANAVQVQRGLGSSKLAISSVGGTVNIVSKATERNEGGFARTMVGNDSFLKGTVSYDSGLNDNGWGFSLMLDHWQAHRKYRQGTQGSGQNYFLSIGKLLGDHNFNFLVFGAPQQHMQAWSQPEETAREFRKYNQHWGVDQGEIISERTNFYHKPVMNFNWDWDISDDSSLSTVAYASFGRGGGTGPRGRGRIREPDYNIAGGISGQIDFDAIREANAQIGLGEPRNDGYIRRASMNNHQWFGVVSNYSHDFNENWSMNAGADIRFYSGDHFRQVIDFFGLTGWANDRPDGRVVTESFSINPWKTFFTSADENERINYDYSEDINYQGAFSQIEYGTDAFSAFFQGAISNQSYQREDRFARDANGNQTTKESEKTNKTGYNLKTGAAYNFNDSHSIFANAGFYSRQPFLDNIFAATAELATPAVENEEITGIEAGYKLTEGNFKLNVNLYRTEWANRFVANGNVIASYEGQDEENNPILGQEIDISREQTDVTQIHQGIEIDGQYRMSNKLRLGAYVSIGDWKYADATPYRTRDFRDNTFFTNADINDYRTREGETLSPNFFNGEVNLDGVEISNAPQTSFGINGMYNVTNGFKIGLDYNYFTRLYDFIDVADVVAQGSSYETTELDGYGVVDFTTAYDFNFGGNKFVLAANIYNLLNSAYISQTDAFGVFYGLGRTWNASLKYNF